MKSKLIVTIFLIISICMGCFTIMFKYNDSNKWDELFLNYTKTLKAPILRRFFKLYVTFNSYFTP